MRTQVSSIEAYQLMHDGVQALSQVEANGLRIDEAYLEKATKRVSHKIRGLEYRLKNSGEYKTWQKKFRDKTKLGSSEQLADLIFKVLGYECREKTEKGKPKTDESAFTHIDLPFIKEYFSWKKLKKAHDTYLRGIKQELIDGYLHPFFHLHTVRSFRSSSGNPNFQNFPIRNANIGKIIRQCFIPRDDHFLIEIDFSGIEVKISFCYHQDPVMGEYLRDATKDMHRDMACECYLLTVDEVNKQLRYCAKNMYVFPQFYGSFYVDCAKSLWEAADRMDLKVGETPLKEHLLKKGIREPGIFKEEATPRPGSFVYHIKKVEEDFWGRRFKVYKQWKEEWWRQYQRECGFTTLTGFRINGAYRRNEVINLPVQGSAFHCLLWSLIQIQKWLVKTRMKSKLVGQIHDSILVDCHKDEIQDVLSKAKQVMTVDLLKKWKWIITPLDTESDVAETSWADKKPWVEKNGLWIPKAA